MTHKNIKYQASALAIALCLGSTLIGEAALAQSATGADEVVIVTGSRRARSAANSASPIDVVGRSELSRSADSDVAALVRNSVPSFNVNTQSINDAASVVRPANLRGMAPDHTLVLVNGKRRHRASVIAFIGGGIANGSQGADISVFPAIALKQVEVLRDGAAAQYGSDAIAGVMNFILRTDSDSLDINGKWGQTYEGDGASYTVSANLGVPLGENGFANLSIEYGNQDATSRSIQRADAAALLAAGNTAIRTPAVQVWGQPDIMDELKIWLNTGFEIGEHASIYAFGNYASKDTDGGFYFRNPNSRGGVYSNDGGVTRLVGDTTPGTGTTCPTITIGSAGEAAAVAAVRADPTCFIFNEMFPGGFTPRFGGEVQDSSFVIGAKGEIGKLGYDVSFNTGRNEVNFHIRNTINASYGPNTQNAFNPGGQSQTEKNFNIDLDYAVEVAGFSSPLNIAGGYEWRDEQFQLKAGEAQSYTQGPLATQGFSVGSNGFNGFTPLAAGKWNQTSQALYLDLEADVTEHLVLGAAIRHETYDTFGDTTNFKLSALVNASDNLTLRSTYSTGYRAPTSGQANIVNTTTQLLNGVLANIGTVPPTSVLGRLIGGKPLKPETSRNFSVGAGFNFGKLHGTLDYFNIEMEDRLTQAAGRDVSQATIDGLPLADRQNLRDFGVLNSLFIKNADLSSFTYFTNDFGSTTHGIDLVMSYPLEMMGGTTNLTFVANYTDTSVDYGHGTLGSTAVKEIEDALPHFRGSLTGTRDVGQLSFLGRVNYFGKFNEMHADDDTIPIFAKAQVTVDAEATYHLTEQASVTLGAQNLLDSYPTRNPWDFILGAKYPVTAPAGFNGGFYYLKLSFRR
ncbi:MAG: iron complex outermembrane recepter protein [Hyphomonadaceae bacterium]|nr:MAG: iron complex outermembrane recepter protein [Hyphomonadaceae bacterium]